MLGDKNKNYSLYLSGVINENQYYTNELDEHMTVLLQFAEAINFVSESQSAKWIKRLNEDATLAPEDKEQAQDAVSWFKKKMNSMKDAISMYVNKGNDFIMKKAFEVLMQAEKWAGYYVDEAGEIQQVAKNDARIFEQRAKDFDEKFKKYWDGKYNKSDEIKESIMGSIGKFVSMKAFNLIKFILTDVVDVLFRTALNVMKSILTPEAQGVKMLVGLMLAVVYPLIGFFGTGAGASFLLIPAGLYYIVQLIKAIYSHVTGKPYLAAG
jgi:5-methylcytosine-specific restriction endonuclease McrBC GTP-binding regulatory subunit McrB